MLCRPRVLRAVALLLTAALFATGCGDDDVDDVADGGGGAGSGPVVGDHWHAAYGIYVCGQFLDPLPHQSDPAGIHTHNDGVIHLHPFVAQAAGPNAQFGVFLASVGVEASDTEIRFPNTAVLSEERDDCDGQPAVVQVLRWADAGDAADGAPPDDVVTSDVAAVRFRNDREAYVLAFAPQGADIPGPPSVPNLDRLTDVG